MSEQGDLNQAIVEEGRAEQEVATPENGIVKSESLDEEEKLELQVSRGDPFPYSALCYPLPVYLEYLQTFFFFLKTLTK